MAKVIPFAIRTDEGVDAGCVDNLLLESLKGLVRTCAEALSGSGSEWPGFVIAESHQDVSFDAYKAFDWSKWKNVIFFGKEAELRWRREGGLVSAVLITDSDIETGNLQCDLPGGVMFRFPGDGTIDIGDDYEVRDDLLVLWGGRRAEDGTWREKRIPRALKYPTDEEGQPCLSVREYINPEGVTEFSRFVELVIKPVGKEREID